MPNPKASSGIGKAIPTGGLQDFRKNTMEVASKNAKSLGSSGVGTGSGRIDGGVKGRG